MNILFLLASILICGGKGFTDQFIRANPERWDILYKEWFGLKAESPRIKEALARIREKGRIFHDLTNLLIEIIRWYVEHPSGVNFIPGIAKVMSGLVLLAGALGLLLGISIA